MTGLPGFADHQDNYGNPGIGDEDQDQPTEHEARVFDPARVSQADRDQARTDQGEDAGLLGELVRAIVAHLTVPRPQEITGKTLAQRDQLIADRAGTLLSYLACDADNGCEERGIRSTIRLLGEAKRPLPYETSTD